MSSIIKAGGTAREIQGVAFNFEDMSQQANKYLDGIRAQAAEIVAKAHKEAAAVRSKAEDEGRQAAMRAVEKVLDDKVGKRMETLLPALQKAVEGIQHARHSWLTHWEKSAVRLSTAIAGRVIRRELPKDPQITLRLVTEALELAAGSTRTRILLNPADHETLGSQVQRLVKEIGRVGPAEIVADPQIAPGGCRVETQHGVIDQQIQTQLDRIEEELT